MEEKAVEAEDVDVQLLSGSKRLSKPSFLSLSKKKKKDGRPTKGSTLISWIKPNLSPNIKTYGKIAFKGMTRKSMARFIRLPLQVTTLFLFTFPFPQILIDWHV